MYIQQRTKRKCANLAKSFQDEAHLLAGHHISRLKVPALLRCEMFASKQMGFASTVTLKVHRP